MVPPVEVVIEQYDAARRHACYNAPVEREEKEEVLHRPGLSPFL